MVSGGLAIAMPTPWTVYVISRAGQPTHHRKTLPQNKVPLNQTAPKAQKEKEETQKEKEETQKEKEETQKEKEETQKEKEETQKEKEETQKEKEATSTFQPDAAT